MGLTGVVPGTKPPIPCTINVSTRDLQCRYHFKLRNIAEIAKNAGKILECKIDHFQLPVLEKCS